MAKVENSPKMINTAAISKTDFSTVKATTKTSNYNILMKAHGSTTSRLAKALKKPNPPYIKETGKTIKKMEKALLCF